MPSHIANPTMVCERNAYINIKAGIWRTQALTSRVILGPPEPSRKD